jgi:hypothetical protein
MREHESLTSNTFQTAEVPVVRLEVPVVRLEVPVVRQFCHEKIDSDRFAIDRCLFPLKRGV